MKKLMTLFLGLFLITSITTSCSSDDDNTTNETSGNSDPSSILNKWWYDINNFTGDIYFNSNGEYEQKVTLLGTELTSNGTWVWEDENEGIIKIENLEGTGQLVSSVWFKISDIQDHTLTFQQSLDGVDYSEKVFYEDGNDDGSNGGGTDTSNNYLTVDDAKYTLSQGYIENYGKGDFYEGYNLDLVLVSSGITVTEDAYGEYKGTGSGQVIYFEMFSSNAAALNTGEYTYSSTEPYPVGTFDYSDFSISYNADNETGNWTDITSGTVTIGKEGDVYSITINCIGEEGEVVKGFFKGTLTYFNYSEETESISKSALKRSKKR